MTNHEGGRQGFAVKWRELRCRGCRSLLFKHAAVGRVQIVCPRSKCRTLTEAVLE